MSFTNMFPVLLKNGINITEEQREAICLQTVSANFLIKIRVFIRPIGGMIHKISSFLLMTSVLLYGANCSSTSETDTAECVVLLHGLGRTTLSMRPLARYLENRGFRTVNIGYPSTRHPVEWLTEYLGEQIRQYPATQGQRVRLHFVTHSLGGIVLRSFLEKNRPSNLGRVVMLGPPSRGSELVDRLGRTFVFGLIYGPSGRQLGTGPRSVPKRLGPVDFELGVIAGCRSVNPVFSMIIPGPDDGKVSVERSKVEGMADFLVVPRSHPFIMNSPEVAEQTEYFLLNGRFRH